MKLGVAKCHRSYFHAEAHQSCIFHSDQLVKRWEDWLELTKDEALTFYSFRFLLENVMAIFRSNDALQSNGGHVGEWLLQLHKPQFLVAIRRELEEGGDHHTLMNFLYELEDYSEVVLTRQRYVALYPDNFAKQHGIPDEHFDGKLGTMCKWPKSSSADDCVSRESIVQAREMLARESRTVLKYANWVVLHRTSVKPLEVTWADVYRVMNRMFDAYATYYNIITASVYVSRYAVHQYDWSEPLTYTWITERFEEWKPPE